MAGRNTQSGLKTTKKDTEMSGYQCYTNTESIGSPIRQSSSRISRELYEFAAFGQQEQFEEQIKCALSEANRELAAAIKRRVEFMNKFLNNGQIDPLVTNQIENSLRSEKGKETESGDDKEIHAICVSSQERTLIQNEMIENLNENEHELSLIHI